MALGFVRLEVFRKASRILRRVGSPILRLSKTAVYLTIYAVFLLRIRRPRYLDVRGKSVLVVGSGPIKETSLSFNPDVIVAVNGSSANVLHSFGLKPTALVCDASLFNSQELQSNPGRQIVVQEGYLDGFVFEKLVVVQSNQLKADVSLKRFVRYNSLGRIGRLTRRAISRYVSSSPILEDWSNTALTSTGMFTVALTIACGAKEVEIAGVGLRYPDNETTHYYGEVRGIRDKTNVDGNQSGGQISRNHSAADSHLLTAMILRGGKIVTSHPDLKPLCQLSSWSH